MANEPIGLFPKSNLAEQQSSYERLAKDMAVVQGATAAATPGINACQQIANTGIVKRTGPSTSIRLVYQGAQQSTPQSGLANFFKGTRIQVRIQFLRGLGKNIIIFNTDETNRWQAPFKIAAYEGVFVTPSQVLVSRVWNGKDSSGTIVSGTKSIRKAHHEGALWNTIKLALKEGYKGALSNTIISCLQFGIYFGIQPYSEKWIESVTFITKDANPWLMGTLSAIPTTVAITACSQPFVRNMRLKQKNKNYTSVNELLRWWRFFKKLKRSQKLSGLMRITKQCYRGTTATAAGTFILVGLANYADHLGELAREVKIADNIPDASKSFPP